MVKEANAVTEQYGCQVDNNLVGKTCFETLLINTRAKDADIFITGRRFGLLNGAFDTFRNKCEGQAAYGFCNLGLFCNHELGYPHHASICELVIFQTYFKRSSAQYDRSGFLHLFLAYTIA